MVMMMLIQTFCQNNQIPKNTCKQNLKNQNNYASTEISKINVRVPNVDLGAPNCYFRVPILIYSARIVILGCPNYSTTE